MEVLKSKMVKEKEAHVVSQEQSGKGLVELRAGLEAWVSELLLKEQAYTGFQERFNQSHGEKRTLTRRW